jgi:hypothetical protein
LRIDEFMAIDRHHDQRKVERAGHRLREEVLTIRGRQDILTRAHWRWARILDRLRGVALIPRLYRTAMLPFVRLPPRSHLYFHQIALPRRFMR